MLTATPLIRFHAFWRFCHLDWQKPSDVQQNQLMALLRKAASTRFGREHGFASINSVLEFQKRVPLRTYEDFWIDYWKSEFPRLEDCTWPGKIPYFALTSGTTKGVTKYIPVSREMLWANIKAAWDILFHHLLNRPDSLILGGKSLLLGGSTKLYEEAPGIWSGDLSGIEANELPWWLVPYVLPPWELALLGNWEEKIEKIARLCMSEDVRAITGTPNWMLLFFDKFSELNPAAQRHLSNHFPNLELIVHGGINFHPYASRFADLLTGSRAELREVYPASEAFVAIADRGPGEGMRLIIDNGVFYEFVPREELRKPNPTRHWIGNAEVGVDYALILSTCAGAWGYILGDTIRFIELEPPRIVITGRTSYLLSSFGEHLIDEEIEQAVAAAALSIGATVADYAVAPIFNERAGPSGWHHYIVEFANEIPSDERLAVFRDALEQKLSTLNADYRAHRVGGYDLAPPRVQAAPPGTYRAWMRSRGQLGGQHKVPRIINDADLFAKLRAFVSNVSAKPS